MFDDIIIMKAHCGNISEQAIELKTLFSHNSDELNKIKALTNIEMIKNSIAELELYIKDL